MLKSWFISLLVVLILAAAYTLNLFGWLASGGALIFAMVLVIGALIAAWIVLGNPLQNKHNNDD